MKEGKTEVIDLKEINRQKKKRAPRKKKYNLGIWKYFIAIGGVVIASMIFFTVWFYNSRGGLVEITYQDYLKYDKMDARTVVYIGSNDNISKEFTPVLQDIAKKRGKQYQYLDISDVDDVNVLTKIENVFVETQGSLIVPMLVVIENGEVVDERTDKTIGTPTGLMLGYLDRNTVTKFLQDNKVY